MSMHTKKQTIDNKTDNSDILSILESIESMFEVCQKVVNGYTQAALMLSITTEAEMLLLKLQVMEERWKVHLPFKEATNVNFYTWGKKIEQMAKAVGGGEGAGDSEYSLDEYCPSKHYLLDLYECLDESSSHNGGVPYYADPDVSKFISEQARIRAKITRKWSEYRLKFSALVPRELNEHLDSVLLAMSDRNVNIRMTCHTVLRNLSSVLYRLYDAPGDEISIDQFRRLAERVMDEEEYGVPSAKRKADHELKEAKYNHPGDQWEAWREDHINVSRELIMGMTMESKVFGFLEEGKNMFDNPAGLGNYLWSVRNNISSNDLCDVIELLYRIAYLERDREQHQTQAAEQVASTQDARSEPKDALAVYRRRKSAKLRKPVLPNFFNTKITSNEQAVEAYYKALHKCGIFIGRVLIEEEKNNVELRIYAGWKWKHLRDAFVRLSFFRADSNKKGFAQHLADVFPYLEASNIQRGFNSRGGYTDSNANARIIKDIMSEFEEVARIAGIEVKI